MRKFLFVLLILPAFSFSNRLNKDSEIKKLVSILNSTKSDFFEEVDQIPDNVLNQLTATLRKETGNDQEFILNGKYDAPSRSYSYDKGVYRRLNFGLKKGDEWVISYHVSTKRLSYNNVLYLDLKKKKTTIKSFQINRPSRNPEGLLEKLNDPNAVELAYPIDGESVGSIF